MRRVGSEEALYEQLAQYLSYQHKKLSGLWHFDLAGVNNASPVSRGLYSRLNDRGFPDFQLLYPIAYPGMVVAGLLLELKKDGTRLKRRDGSWATVHIAEQAEMLERLREAGYVAEFAVGLDDAIAKVTDYLAPIKAPDVKRPVAVVDVVNRPKPRRCRIDLEPF